MLVLISCLYISDTYAQSSIPTWIKTNAGWWAEDAIDDETFLQAIQFLIKEGIIIIPPTESSATSESQEIPNWVKNNAGWWAEGVIDDETFLQAIQFLIKNGIIIIEQPESIPEDNGWGRDLNDCVPTSNEQVPPIAYDGNYEVIGRNQLPILFSGTDANCDKIGYFKIQGPSNGGRSSIDCDFGEQYGCTLGLLYTAYEGFTGTDIVTYEAVQYILTGHDASGIPQWELTSSQPATISITVLPHIPFADNQNVDVDGETQIVLSAYITDPNPQLTYWPMEFSILTAPSHGSLHCEKGLYSLSLAKRISLADSDYITCLYTPDELYVGNDTFSFTATNQYDTSEPAIVNLNVN